MEGAKAYILPGVAALVLLGYYAWSASSSSDEPAPEAAPQGAPKSDAPGKAPSPANGPEAEPSSPAPQDVGTPDSADADADAERPRTRDRAAREALRERIEQAQRSRLGRGGDEPIDREALGQLQPEYIQERIKDDLVPLAVECYEMALERDAALAGRMVLRFLIAGEPDVGGIVEEAELTPDSDLQEPELAECMRESMMTVTFEPPPGGGTVEVNYPFVFEPGDE